MFLSALSVTKIYFLYCAIYFLNDDIKLLNSDIN